MFTNDDIRQIEERGSSVQTVKDQVERFKKGFPWMKIVAPATPAKGISVLSEAEVEEAGKYYECRKMQIRSGIRSGIKDVQGPFQRPRHT